MGKKKNKRKKFYSRKFLILSLIVLVIFIVVAYSVKDHFLSQQPKAVNYFPQNLATKNKMLFSDAGDLYTVTLDGSRPKKIASVSRIITEIHVLQNGDILIAGGGRYLGRDGKLKKDWSYEEESPAVSITNWILKNGESATLAIKKEEYSQLLMDYALPSEKGYIYTEELPTGGANILVRMKGRVEKIGFLTSKVDTIQACDSSTSRTFYPREFTTFSGKYLLGGPLSAGGICGATTHIFTREGKALYKFDETLRSAAWIGENKMLITNNNGEKLEVLTISENGSVTFTPVNHGRGYFSFNSDLISPSKKYLFLGLASRSKGAIYDIVNNKVEYIDQPLDSASWSKSSDILLLRYVKEEVDEGESIYSSHYFTYDPKTSKTGQIATTQSGRDTSPIFVLR